MSEIRKYTVSQMYHFSELAGNRKKNNLIELSSVIRAASLADKDQYKKFINEISNW